VRILFATDGSRGAAIAEDFLLSLPLSCADEVTVVTSPTVSERESFALLARRRWRFAARDVPTTTAMRGGSPARVAEAVALERGSELIVVGSRGLGQLGGRLLGSVARALARDGVTPVLVVRARREAPRRVLVAIDGSDDARAAVELLARLPLPMAARLSLLRVMAPEDDPGQSDAVAAHARVVLGKRIADWETVERGHIGEEVLRRALRTSSDMIVLGSRGQAEGGGLLRGSTVDHVLSHAHCAVLVAKAPPRARAVESPAAVRIASAF